MEKKIKTSKGFKKITGDNSEIKILIGVMESTIKIVAHEDIEVYKGHFNLSNLQEKDRYFKMYDNIEDAYDDILTSLTKDKYEIIKEGSHLIINLEIEVNYKKNIVSLILEKNELKNEDLIKSLLFYGMQSRIVIQFLRY